MVRMSIDKCNKLFPPRLPTVDKSRLAQQFIIKDNYAEASLTCL
jgi:hypothetical protein